MSYIKYRMRSEAFSKNEVTLYLLYLTCPSFPLTLHSEHFPASLNIALHLPFWLLHAVLSPSCNIISLTLGHLCGFQNFTENSIRTSILRAVSLPRSMKYLLWDDSQKAVLNFYGGPTFLRPLSLGSSSSFLGNEVVSYPAGFLPGYSLTARFILLTGRRQQFPWRMR